MQSARSRRLRIVDASFIDRVSDEEYHHNNKGGPMPCMKRGVKKAAKKTAKKKTRK